MSATESTPHIPADALLEFRNISKSYFKSERRLAALDNVTISVPRGEFLVIVGPSGCGKSTLLNIAAGLLMPSSGIVSYAGRPIVGINRDVGYVTQRDNLLPWLSLRANIEIALKIRQVPKAERGIAVNSLIDQVGLHGFEEHYPRELSGGMRKRAALVRTLSYKPSTLLMDEPFGALDAQLKVLLQAQLLRLWESYQNTVVFVTHDLTEAIVLADRVAVMSARPGMIRGVWDIDIARPRDVARVRFTERFAELHEELWNAIEEDLTQYM